MSSFDIWIWIVIFHVFVGESACDEYQLEGQSTKNIKFLKVRIQVVR